jgi:hypothetical protein
MTAALTMKVELRTADPAGNHYYAVWYADDDEPYLIRGADLAHTLPAMVRQALEDGILTAAPAVIG